MSQTTDRDLGELASSRRLPASAERVWQAFTTPAEVAAFWGGRHATVPADSVTIDLRVGGRFALTTVGPDGSAHPLAFVYTELEEPHRIGFCEPLTGILTTVDIAPDGDHTLVTIHQRQVPVALRGRQAAEGLAGIFDALAAVVSTPTREA